MKIRLAHLVFADVQYFFNRTSAVLELGTANIGAWPSLVGIGCNILLNKSDNKEQKKKVSCPRGGDKSGGWL